ncbi:UNVERIFIED_CONTAM: hypothetical protein Sradi_5296500 [Sesamum radiatum]|uniref:Reverse transcriptase domain-containing protein n=1 Tax=Sesamum radiatum TaxID=300843 RepID=A0AAW2LPT8_SESRA
MERIEPVQEHKSIELIARQPDRATRIGSGMSKSMETMMIEFLRKSVDLLTWSPSDFKGIDPKVIVHRLNVDPMMRPIKQKKTSFGAKRNRIIEEEFGKLLEAGYFEECRGDVSKAGEQNVQELGWHDHGSDMLVKSRNEEDHLEDLKQAFKVMRTYGMKLNPSKCTVHIWSAGWQVPGVHGQRKRDRS